ncbi:MAG: hypothetical protein A4S09_04975 [Proteobacteria bacterium SG_bin7]|nr:MAG: hypothetical protein A4S09_04975 [Proteobacteria bacterium SG_bin7]
MSDEKILKSFQFHIPVELEKSQNAEGEEVWAVKGIASTPDTDLQGEVVDQNGLDISMLKAGRGLFNVDHQRGPENVIGQIEDAEFVKQDGKKALFVKGYLFKHQPRAQAFYNILKSLKKGAGPRVHMSIEGKILQRDVVNKSVIRNARIDKVALTLDPVNPYTYVDLAKSLASGNLEEIPEPVHLTVEKNELAAAIKEGVEKALAAGAGPALAPTMRSGGEAMTKESLDSKLKRMGKKDKKSQKRMLKSILQRMCELHPEEDPRDLLKVIASKLKNIEGEDNV